MASRRARLYGGMFAVLLLGSASGCSASVSIGPAPTTSTPRAPDRAASAEQTRVAAATTRPQRPGTCRIAPPQVNLPTGEWTARETILTTGAIDACAGERRVRPWDFHRVCDAGTCKTYLYTASFYGPRVAENRTRRPGTVHSDISALDRPVPAPPRRRRRNQPRLHNDDPMVVIPPANPQRAESRAPGGPLRRRPRRNLQLRCDTHKSSCKSARGRPLATSTSKTANRKHPTIRSELAQRGHFPLDHRRPRLVSPNSRSEHGALADCWPTDMPVLVSQAAPRHHQPCTAHNRRRARTHKHLRETSPRYTRLTRSTPTPPRHVDERTRRSYPAALLAVPLRELLAPPVPHLSAAERGRALPQAPPRPPLPQAPTPSPSASRYDRALRANALNGVPCLT